MVSHHGDTAERSHIRVVARQGVLPIRMVSQGDTAERSHIRVVAKQGVYPSGWFLIRVVIIHQHDRSLECSFIRCQLY